MIAVFWNEAGCCNWKGGHTDDRGYGPEMREVQISTEFKGYDSNESNVDNTIQ